MPLTAPAQRWLDLAREPVVDAEIEIVDPHHHLWSRPGWTYELDELHADTGSGHRVVQTVFVECRSAYREDGPDHLRPVGETEYVTAIAEASEARDGATIAGIVGHVDLRLAPELLDEALDAHLAAAGGRFVGVRHAGAHDADPEALSIPGRAPAGLYADDDFRRGVEQLGARGLTYDTWHYHHQNRDFAALAAAVPGTTMVLDHLGTPLGVGRFAGRRDAVHAAWRDDIDAIAACPNVVAKLGGLAMPDNGYGWHERDRPPGSREVLAAHGRWYRHMIERFGADRCMFESNFPVDRVSLPYGVYWNAVQLLVDEMAIGGQDRRALFAGTARRVYGLDGRQHRAPAPHSARRHAAAEEGRAGER